MHITNHACERFLERELGYITWTKKDIDNARKYLKSFVSSNKHLNLSMSKKDNRVYQVLVGKFIMVINKAKKALITLYPYQLKINVA